MQLCAVDNGYFETKVKTDKRIYRFRSKIEKTSGEVLENPKDTIEYMGETYVIGRGTDDISNDKTKSLIHKLCTLKALADSTTDIQDFKLVIDLPLIHYKNKHFREEFEKYMSNPILNFVRHNGTLKQINIKKCIVIPQGIAALYSEDARRYKNKIVAVLDIGGLTVDGCITEDLKPIKDSVFTINKGTIILENTLKTTLNERLFLNIQDYEMDYIIKNGVPGREQKSKKIMYEVFYEHISSIIREMKAKNWSVETLNILIIGGGALKIKELLVDFLPRVEISKNPIYANTLGLFNIGRMI